MKITIAIILAAATAACVDQQPLELPPPPTIAWPTVWHGLDEQGNPIVVMTPATYERLEADLQHAEIWMRHADIALGDRGSASEGPQP